MNKKKALALVLLQGLFLTSMSESMCPSLSYYNLNSVVMFDLVDVVNQ